MKPPKTKQEYISEGLDAAAIRDLDLIEDAAFARGKNQGISIGRAFTEKIGPATDLVPSTPGGVGNPPATPDSAPAGGRPAPPATTLEQVLAESERQEEAAQKFAQSLTAPQVES